MDHQSSPESGHGSEPNPDYVIFALGEQVGTVISLADSLFLSRQSGAQNLN
jgi:hypothetical protein